MPYKSKNFTDHQQHKLNKVTSVFRNTPYKLNYCPNTDMLQSNFLNVNIVTHMTTENVFPKY